MSDDAMIESQRRLAALGLFRRVRITELPRTGSLTRDVLVDLEEADDHDDRLRRRPRGRRHRRPRRRRQRRRRQDRHRPARLLQHQPPQPVGQEPIGHVVRPRHASGVASAGVDNPDPTDDGGYGFNDYRGLVHVPRAARLRHHRRRAVHGVRRAEPAHQLYVQSQGRDDRLRAPPRRVHGRPAATPSTTPRCSTSRSRPKISC